jgi:hypothetical protein
MSEKSFLWRLPVAEFCEVDPLPRSKCDLAVADWKCDRVSYQRCLQVRDRITALSPDTIIFDSLRSFVGVFPGKGFGHDPIQSHVHVYGQKTSSDR